VILFTAFSKTEEIQLQRLVYFKKSKPTSDTWKSRDSAAGSWENPALPYGVETGLPAGCGASLMHTDEMIWYLEVTDCVAVPGTIKWKEKH